MVPLGLSHGFFSLAGDLSPSCSCFDRRNTRVHGYMMERTRILCDSDLIIPDIWRAQNAYNPSMTLSFELTIDLFSNRELLRSQIIPRLFYFYYYVLKFISLDKTTKITLQVPAYLNDVVLGF